MHGAAGCAGPIDNVRKGDDWLAANLPPILDYASAHDGVVMLVWDEPDWAGHIPFIILGPQIKPGHVSTVAYSHSSLLKTTERLLGLPVLGAAVDAQPVALFEAFFRSGSLVFGGGHLDHIDRLTHHRFRHG